MGRGGQGMPAGIPMPTEKNSVDVATKKRVLLSNFCRLDFEGARLSSDGWKRFKPYTSMSFSPGYRRFVIVTRFNVEPAEPLAQLLYVSFRVVGYYDDLGGYVESAMSERVEFEVEESNNEVSVTKVSPEIPHVSPRAAIAWLNSRLDDPKTKDIDRAHLKSAVEQLNKLVPQPAQATPVSGK
jgi:hypothetical protein